MGKEPYYIDLICNYIVENVLEEHEKDFNQTIFYGKDCNPSDLIETSQRFPMMSNYQLVILKEAQSNDKKTQLYDKLTKYLENPLNSTILVICFKYDTISNKTLLTAAKKIGYVFDSKEIYSNKLPAWIESYIKERGYQIDIKSASIIAEYIGTDLTKLTNELNKLFIAIGEKTKKITPELIEENIGISKDFNYFELQNSIGYLDVKNTLKIVNYFAENEKSHPFVVINKTMFGFFEKLLKIHSLKEINKDSISKLIGLHPFLASPYVDYVKNFHPNKLLKTLSIIREYDLKSKGVENGSTSDGQLLKEMIFKIIYC